MTMFLRKLRGVVIVAVAVVIAQFGARMLLRQQGEARKERVAPPRRVDPVPATKPPPPGRPLVGIVRDADGRPVAGAILVAGLATSEEPNHRTGTTGSDGRCELTPAGRSARLEYVVAYKEGFAPASALRFEDRGDPGEIELRLLPPVPFMGDVKDGQGKPVAGAIVQMDEASYSGIGDKYTQLHAIEPVVRGTPLERLFRATTDTRGRFQFPALPRRALVRLTVTASGIGEYEKNTSLRPDGGFGHRGTAEAPAQIVLKPVTRVTGRIMTRLPGVKVDGLNLVLYGAQPSRSFHPGGARFDAGARAQVETRTDEEGRFEFDGLVGERADIFLRDYRGAGRWTYRPIIDRELEPGRVIEVEIELIAGVLAEGRVLDAETGEPLDDVSVCVAGPNQPQDGTVTDKDGRYRFRLPAGRAEFSLCGSLPPGYGQVSRVGPAVDILANARKLTIPAIEIRRDRREGTEP
jgi:protocatechuate 3,4-dioxygenase beta subunit